MNKGSLLAMFLAASTVALILVGTVWPVQSAVAYAGAGSLLRSSSTPESAATNLADEIRMQAWDKAYASLANKAQLDVYKRQSSPRANRVCSRTRLPL